MKKSTKIITVISSLAFLFSMALPQLVAYQKNNSEVIAKIGNSKITMAEYNSAYQGELQYIQNILGQALTEEQIEMFKIKRNTMQKLIWQHMLDNFVKDNKLKIDKSTIFEQISKLPYFKDQDNKFSYDNFQKVLQANNITESDYIKDTGNNIIKSIVIKSLTNHSVKRNNSIDKLFDYKLESRDADIVLIKKNHIKKYNPSTKEIENFFNENQKTFYTPEIRKIKYIEIDQDSLDGDIEISTEEIDKEFQKNIDIYSNYSQKNITNIIFPDKESLEKYTKDDIHIKNFDEFINSLDKSKIKVSKLENIKPDDLPDPLNYIVGDMQENDISQPVQTPLGWHIIKVNNVQNLNDEMIAKIKEEIKNELLEKQKSDKIYNLIDNIDNNIVNNHSTIDQIATEYELKTKTIDKIEKTSNVLTPERKKISQNVIDKIFELEKGKVVGMNMNEDEESSYIFFTIDEIYPQKPQTLEEVKQKIIEMLQEKNTEKEMELLAEKTTNTIINNKYSTNFQNSDTSVEIKTSQQLYRYNVAPYLNPTQHYPKQMIDDVFQSKKINHITKAYNYEDGLVLALVKKINHAEKNDTDSSMKNILAQINDILHTLSNEDLYNYMQDIYKVKIHHSPFVENKNDNN